MPITFADFFCGIGGFHQAVLRVDKDAVCVVAVDSDTNVHQVYQQNYSITPQGDIRNINPTTIPKYSLLCAGFPCQPFSKANMVGSAKSNEKRMVVFELIKFVRYHRPNIILLENVPSLSKEVIENLQSSLKHYHFVSEVLSPHQFGIPQKRERLYLVFTLEKPFDFSEVTRKYKCQRVPKIKNILIGGDRPPLPEEKYTLIEKPSNKSLLKKVGHVIPDMKRNYKSKTMKGNFTAVRQYHRIYSSEGLHPTLLCSELTGRYYVYDEGVVRKLSLKECYLLQDFPSTFVHHPTRTQAYRQVGNAVCVKVVEVVIEELLSQGFIR